MMKDEIKKKDMDNSIWVRQDLLVTAVISLSQMKKKRNLGYEVDIVQYF